MQIDIGFLETTLLGSSLRAWIIALVIFSVSLFAIRLIRGMLDRRLSALAARTRTQLDDMVRDLIRNTKFFFPLFIALYLGVQALTLPPNVAGAVRAATIIAILLQAAVWGNGLIAFSINRYMQTRMAEDAATATSVGALRFIGKLVLWTVVLLLALDNLGVDITALVTGLGIGGIAVALALQNVLADLLASLSIVLDKPFVIGDFIIVGEHLGTVEYIGLKTTRVRSLSGEQLVFSNGDLLGSRIRNYKRMAERRVVFSFGVVYQTPHEKLATIPGMVREIIEGTENTRFDRAHFKSYGDSALIFEVVYYVLSADYALYMDVQQQINLLLYQRFEEQGIEFAYPTQTLYVQKQE